MRKSWIGWSAAAVLACGMSTSSFATAAVEAPTVQAYSFAGDCGDCDGIGHGTLTLQNYTQGSEITEANFVSFTYESNLIETSFDRSSLGSIAGELTNLPGPNDVSFFANEDADFFRFFSYSGGAWCLGTGLACTADEGDTHIWSLAATGSVPEPLTWALMVSGFGLIGTQLRAARKLASA